MTKRLISFLIALCLLIAIPLSARYKYNPFTRKLDYYEPVSGADLGDLGDVTLTGLATGNVLYYNGTAWVNLATGANTNVLTLAGGVPTWAADNPIRENLLTNSGFGVWSQSDAIARTHTRGGQGIDSICCHASWEAAS